jgi:hypothetical protein
MYPSLLLRAFGLICILALMGCRDPSPEVHRADFTRLAGVLDSVELELGVWGGSRRGRVAAIQERGAKLVIAKDELQLRFSEPGGWVRVSPEALGLPAHLPRGGTLVVTAAMTGPKGELILGVLGTRGRLQDTFSLRAAATRFTLDVQEAPLLGDLQGRVTAIQFMAADTGSLIVTELDMIPARKAQALIDRFGQRRAVDFPDKLQDTMSYSGDRIRETAYLDSLPPLPPRDEFGGYSETGLSFPATGFFRTAREGERWYLVSPAGNPFYSLGVNGVRLVSTLNNAALTQVGGRSELFEELPDRQRYGACYREDGAYLSWYCKNALDKYGTAEAWREAVLRRLRRIGFNTIGNWSDTLLYGRDLAYTYTLDTRGNNRLGTGNRLPDVFDPAWAGYVDSTFRRIAAYREDPYLLGYFVDNELHWSEIEGMDTSSHTYAALSALPDATSRQRAYAERYFGTIARLLRRYDPNHLYLGCRFTRRVAGIEAIVAVAGTYLDVLSVNMYSPFTRAETDAWYELVRKPLLIGEHHVPPVDASHLLPRYPAFAPEVRDTMVAAYVRKWKSYPYAVGSHWYQYADQEVAGRGAGGENQPVGLVSVVDRVDERLLRLFSGLAGEVGEAYGREGGR